MHKWRQRRALLAMPCVLAGMVTAMACSQGSPNSAPANSQAAATVVVGAQATIAAQATVLAIPQPTIQAVQATTQALGSRIGGALAQIQPQDVAKLIGTTMGATFDIDTSPTGVPNAEVKQATLHGKDNGAFGRLDQPARQAFAGAGLQVARQAFPAAQIDLNVDDANGNRLLTATYPAGGSPSYQ
jgi:hypothetical protein